MGPDDRELERRVDPTVRWLLRGMWKALFALFVFFLVAWLIQLVR
jgi:hypothetical protein